MATTFSIEPVVSAKLANAPIRAVTPGQFKAALTRLAQDASYRVKATQDPGQIVKDYALSLRELSALRAVAAMSGADMGSIDQLTGATISQHAAAADADQQAEPASDVDVDVSCCSCCCCCCGETAGAPIVA